ncbi:hypothetical protein [Beggiatoa leptomitoformis]|uniref:hypothetical protein n=1 Tax=Beggiatoa leptomitoformis TaxID=288004 RepID=UPI000AD60902
MIDLIHKKSMQKVCKRVLLFERIFSEKYGLQLSEKYVIILTIGVAALLANAGD